MAPCLPISVLIFSNQKRDFVMARRLSGTVMIEGTDSEFWPFSHEHGQSIQNVNLVVDRDQPASKLELNHLRWGGECRVEVEISAKFVGSGNVHVAGEARFYEGTTESTDDLEDTKRIEITVPKGGTPVHHSVSMKNSERFHEDHADVKLSFTNSLVE